MAGYGPGMHQLPRPTLEDIMQYLQQRRPPPAQGPEAPAPAPGNRLAGLMPGGYGTETPSSELPAEVRNMLVGARLGHPAATLNKLDAQKIKQLQEQRNDPIGRLIEQLTEPELRPDQVRGMPPGRGIY